MHEATPPDSLAPGEVTVRPGTADDLVATHTLLLDAISDLVWRMGIQDGARTPSESERLADLQRWRPILEYLTATADQFWIAERNGELLGFARSIVRDGVRELTEFFVSPRAQSDGVGRELLARAMPPGARRTYIMASLDLRAQALYHKLGVYQVCAVYTFHQDHMRFRALNTSETTSGAPSFVPLTAEHLPLLAQLDEMILGHRRDRDHAWLMDQRQGFIAFLDTKPVGYGYVGEPYSGPMLMLNTADFPAALAYAEQIAREQNFQGVGFDVPMLNRTAIKYLLNHGYRMSQFFCFYMCDQQPLHVDKTIITAPMIMV